MSKMQSLLWIRVAPETQEREQMQALRDCQTCSFRGRYGDQDYGKSQRTKQLIGQK